MKNGAGERSRPAQPERTMSNLENAMVPAGAHCNVGGDGGPRQQCLGLPSAPRARRVQAAAAMTASSAIMFALGALCGLSVGVLVMSLIYDR